MLFPTIEFAIFFVIVFALYWLLSKFPTPRKLVLLAASYVFYGAWDWRFLFLLFGVTFVNYAAGLMIDACKREGARKAWLAAAITVNLGTLGFYKYYLFASTNVNNLLLALGLEPIIPVLSVILPVGISFFTFQAMSYSIDVFRREIPADRNLVDVLLYIAFFPQLVAGPIVRASDFVPQLKRESAGRPLDPGRAFLLIAGGLFKKIVIANYLGVLVADPAFENPSAFGGVDLLLGVYAYAFQIFCDFSAYSDIAIGVALLFGFEFPDNFDQPYRAASIQDFWRRWHISLSTWLRDYLYIPLGGNRKGRIRTYANLLTTMLLGGLWHGASWTFVIWGAMHGVALSVERLFSGLFRKRRELAAEKALPWERDAPPSIAARFGSTMLLGVRIALVFNFVCATWVFFRARSTEYALVFFSSMADLAKPVTLATPFTVALLAIGALMHFTPASLKSAARKGFSAWHPAVQTAALGVALLAIAVLSPEGVAPFIYFQF
jgi:D-alanyl-lipoteichoic acid acyltransferase DltB (MBOAT superfamily)